MGFAVSITRFTQYVQVAVQGPADIKSFVELIERLREDTAFWSDRKVLVDLRGVEGELAPAEQIFLGELVARDLQHIDKIASVVPPERLTRKSESAAQEAGMRLRVFSSRQEALIWLTVTPVVEMQGASDFSQLDSGL
ncbi:STAS/SEC14 domain-containing protein [Caenimonas aquaedulcis]|uniref:STAS/SEC14 domain-containing protein n=1 Tax=Caenimonas aquaedulcis TaxID=2793270 RepID=A0A931H3B5_9BURK|nr:STAS/SEC14 domain-containing protein [Caenimonas aquaedulcis]MBG9387772.1 STAS/SEC14 domain-containing protein [Caenimonas aquaedulcis]